MPRLIVSLIVVTCGQLGVEGIFGGLRLRGVGRHEHVEVLFAITDHDVLDRFGRLLTGPGGLPGRAVTVQTGAGRGDPVAEPAAGVCEVAMPAAGARTRSGRGRRRTASGCAARTAPTLARRTVNLADLVVPWLAGLVRRSE